RPRPGGPGAAPRPGARGRAGDRRSGAREGKEPAPRRPGPRQGHRGGRLRPDGAVAGGGPMSSSLKLSPPKPAEDRVWTGPNILSLSRLGWAVALFVCIGFEEWALGLGFFAVAALTDWLDGV